MAINFKKFYVRSCYSKLFSRFVIKTGSKTAYHKNFMIWDLNLRVIVFFSKFAL